MVTFIFPNYLLAFSLVTSLYSQKGVGTSFIYVLCSSNTVIQSFTEIFLARVIWSDKFIYLAISTSQTWDHDLVLSEQI